MGVSLRIQMYHWRGATHAYVERVEQPPGRRIPTRTRLADWTCDTPVLPTQGEAFEWLVGVLEAWQAAGFPWWLDAKRAALPGAPGGGGGDGRVATRDEAPAALQSEWQPNPLLGSGAVGVSDGLMPPGEQQPLF